MATIAYNDIVPRKIIVYSGEPYEVVSSDIKKKNRQQATNQVKMKNLKSGKVVEVGFHQTDSMQEAEISKRDIVYIYTGRGESFFHEVGAPGERFSLPEEVVGDALRWVKEKDTVTAVEWNDEVIGIHIPIKVDLLVTEAPPSVKGNTAQGGSKQVTLETGAVVSTPLFIHDGDVVRINTDTGEYVERVSKQ